MATQGDNTLTRVQQIKIYDDGPQQKLEADGRFGERFGGTGGKYATPRVQSYGMTSHPPKDSQGVTMTLDGNSDKTMIVGLEHPEHRPKNLAEGEFKVYEKWGGYQYGQQDKWHFLVGEAEIRMHRNGKIYINCN